MARDHARIRLDIWDDDDWCDLTHDGQWLYEFLLTHTSLSFAGVGDWRPARIAAKTRDLTAADIEMFAAELEHGRFILIDRDSEEVLVRSFVKHDGLLRSPNMAVALAKDHARVASRVLRAVIVDQLHRLRDADPTLVGWTKEPVQKVLEKRAMTFEEGAALTPPNPSPAPFGTPTRTPSAKGSGTGSDQGFGDPSATPNSLTPISLTPSSPSSPLPETHQRSTRAGA